MARVDGAAAPADVTYYTLACANDLPAEKADRRAEVRTAIIEHLEKITQDPPVGASVDDRADAMSQLSSALRSAGEPEAARRTDEARLELMESAASAASSPLSAAVYDYQRAGAYLALDRGEQAVEMLVLREKQMPDAYEPPARLAWVLGELERHEEALTAIGRAISRSYGPRRLRYHQMQIELLTKLGRVDEGQPSPRRVDQVQRLASAAAPEREDAGRARCLDRVMTSSAVRPRSARLRRRTHR